MSTILKLPKYVKTLTELHAAELAMSPAELQGLLVGMLAGGSVTEEQQWKPLLFDYTNDGKDWPEAPFVLAEQIWNFSANELQNLNMKLSLLLPNKDEDVDLIYFANAFVDWINHFISGFGLVGASLKKASIDSIEALADLEEITKLGIDDEHLDEQWKLLEQVIEHVKICVLTIYAEFAVPVLNQKNEDLDKKIVAPTVH